MNASVLITGGAGFLGINLVRFLLSKGWRIKILDLAPFAYPEAEWVESIQGDIRDEETVRGAASDVDCMVHAAAALPLYSRDDIHSTDVIGTENCLRAAFDLGLRCCVHISSTAVYGIPEHHPVTESSPLVGMGPYGMAKIEAEDICRRFRARGLCVPVLRPKSFIGPERLGIFGLLYEWAASGRHFPLPGGGHQPFQLLDVEDLCHAVWLALTGEPEVANQTFNIGATEFGSMRGDFQTVLDFAGFGRRVLHLPAEPAVWMLEMAHRLGISPVYPWVFRTLTVDSRVSIEKARRALGFTPRFANRDALLRNFEWYLEQEFGVAQEAGVSHRTPWQQGILSFAKLFF